MPWARRSGALPDPARAGRRGATRMSAQGTCCHATQSNARDPICGMSVDVSSAKHRSEYEGQSFYFCCAGCKTKFDAEPTRYIQPAPAALVLPAHVAVSPVKDPVCGMTVDPVATPHHAEHKGDDYHFCAARCRDKFVGDPAKYLQADRNQDAVVPGAIYTCPMHPEVQQEGPGDCPKCGMALEPMMPSLEENDSGELRDMRRRLWSLIGLTLPVFVLAMLPHAGVHLQNAWAGWVEALLASAVVLWGGAPFFARGWRSLRPWQPNMYTLIAVGTGVAW